MENIKIAIVVPSLINRGPVIVVKDIVEQLIGRVSHLVVFYIDDIPAELSFECEVQKLFIKSASKQLNGFDIIHTHMLRPNILISLLPLKNSKKIATLHNYIYEDVANTHNKIIARITQAIWVFSLKKYDRIVCLTKHMQHYYISKGLKKSNTEVIYNGRPRVKFENFINTNLPEDDLINNFKSRYFTIGVSAILSRRKGIEQLVKALKFIPNVGLIILGDGPEKFNLMTLAHELDVEHQCLFLGYKQVACSYFKYFDSFAMPSYSEGFPLAFIEATSYSLPVLVSDLPIFREIVNDDEAVFVELDNIKSMVNAIKILKNNSSTLSKKAYLAFINRFDSVIMGTNYFKLYKSVLNK